MVEAAVEALLIILSPQHLVWLLTGVGLGLVLGIIPGLGGITGMAVLLPLIVGLDPASAIAMLIGIAATTTIGDTFPSILMGVPGTAASQATVVDGYPMAKKGLGSVALGASFASNILGGLIGAFTLFAIVPIARPLILAFGSPELFMLTLLGLSMVVTLTKGATGPALVTALAGMLLGTVGTSAMTGQERLTGGSFFLFDGIDLVVIAIGIFAIPAVLSLLTQGAAVTTMVQQGRGGVARGAKLALKHPHTIVGNSALGTMLGVIPGIGGSVIDWIAYGATKQFARKNRENFGKGDIRGVIAPEAANNAKDGGVLIPTLMFGIPASATAAILLGAFATIGIATGPSIMRPENIYLVLVIIWTLVLANLFGGLISMGLARPLSRISLLSPYVYGPFLLVLMVLATYQARMQWGDVLMVVALGLVAWLMQAIKWPRPPFLIGFVLGASAEQYMWISVSRYGWDWLTWPTTLTLGALILLVLALGFTDVSRRLAAALRQRIAKPEPREEKGPTGTHG